MKIVILSWLNYSSTAFEIASSSQPIFPSPLERTGQWILSWETWAHSLSSQLSGGGCFLLSAAHMTALAAWLRGWTGRECNRKLWLSWHDIGGAVGEGREKKKGSEKGSWPFCGLVDSAQPIHSPLHSAFVIGHRISIQSIKRQGSDGLPARWWVWYFA